MRPGRAALAALFSLCVLVPACGGGRAAVRYAEPPPGAAHAQARLEIVYREISGDFADHVTRIDGADVEGANYPPYDLRPVVLDLRVGPGPHVWHFRSHFTERTAPGAVGRILGYCDTKATHEAIAGRQYVVRYTYYGDRRCEATVEPLSAP